VATFLANYEGYTPGTGITTTNSDDNGDATLNAVSFGGGTGVYSDAEAAHGSLSALLTPSGTNNIYIQYNDSSDFTTGAIRFYIYLTGSPAATCDFPLRFVTSSNATTFSFQLTSARLLRISAGSAAQMTSAMSLNTWHRIEGQMTSIQSSGSIAMQLFTGDSTTQIDAISLSSLSLANPMRGVRMGRTSTTTLAANYFDDFALVSGSNTPIGPVNTTTPGWSSGYDVRIG
jgi:hypothetical protein